MQGEELKVSIRGENLHLFKQCIKKLLESTFILKNKDEKLYKFISRESNRRDISDYMKMMGFDVKLQENCGVCMLIQNESNQDSIGLKRANVITFPTVQYRLLLILWKIYLDNLDKNKENYISKESLVEKINSCELLITRTELNSALKLFRKYNLIDFIEDGEGEAFNIELYPSLQFGYDLDQFTEIVKEYSLTESENTEVCNSDEESENNIEEGFEEGE